MKGQLATGSLIGLLVLIIIGVGVVIPVLTGVLTPATTLTSVTAENITFPLNNTYVSLANNPVDESTNTATLYYYANTSFPLPTGLYDFTTTQVKVIANATEWDIGNVTNGTFYYAYYDYQPSGYITSATSRTILGFVILLIVVIIIVSIVGMIGLGGKR